MVPDARHHGRYGPEGLLQVRRHPFRASEADPHGPDYSADQRVSPVAVRFRWSRRRGGRRCPCCPGHACHAALVSTTTVCAQGWLCWLRCASAVFFFVVAGQDLRHLGRYDQKDSCFGMYKAGIAGDMHLALFSFFWFAGPWCAASWPVWTIRTVAVSCTRLVLLVTCTSRCFPFFGSQVHGARHHGRYGP